MAFEPDKITLQSVLEAVNTIETEKLKLHPSTGYDVIINGKAYPPKEIIRLSHKIATGIDPGLIYGGSQVNKPLVKLGFSVVPKISIWKLGCNWGKGAPSFYEFIKDENIVITEQSFLYKEGDLVIISEGFTVYAIAKVLETPRPITANKNYKKYCNEFDIDYIDSILYASADWYILPETSVFAYELQQGIRMVQKQEIKEKVINLWENQGFESSNLLFYLKNSKESPSPHWNYPCLVLTKNSWDDYGYTTSFDLFHYRSQNEKIEIAQLKILEIESKSTTLSESFDSLDNSYCSLGETIDYYKRLKAEFPKYYKKILRALNDCAFFEKSRKLFEDTEGFKISLLRSSEAQLVLDEAKSIIEGAIKKRKSSFIFEYKIDDALVAHKVDFSFNEDSDLENYFFCIIGKNGTGKTKILSQLANKLTDNTEDGDFIPKRPVFSKIITSSFSYFDKFKFPKKQDTSYDFIGIKSDEDILSEKEIANSLWLAYKKISEDKLKRDLWITSVLSTLEGNYLKYNLDYIISLSSRKEFFQRTDDIFSSGQKIVFHFITRLISVIEDNSLLIFDEPETHLHPNIAGRLLRTLNAILKEFNSFCILSTHSPIIVQEIPSKFIRIFDRQNNFPVISTPSIECFGENLSNISNSIFRANEEPELYKIVLKDLARKYTLEEIENKFNNQLSLNASLFIQTINKNKQ
jgi:predicted ATPase